LKITALDTLSCDAGWRDFSFLRVRTDGDLVGWSEWNGSYGGPGLGAAIEELGSGIIGADPRRPERITADLVARTRHSHGGVASMAIGAIENALLDIKAKDLGVPVYELLGGPIRDRIPLYWSHCGTYRLQFAGLIGATPLRSLADVEQLGREVRASGFRALKTNVFLFDGERSRPYLPGFGSGSQHPELNLTPEVVQITRNQLHAFRSAVGTDVDLMLDLNYNFKTEGFARLGRALDGIDLAWLELDSFEPRALAYVRSTVRSPLASCETLFGRAQYLPFFEARAVDVAIVDVVFNGFLESLKIAALAETYEVNVAPHNFFGPLATLISAHWSASLRNLRTMELEVDDVPWRNELLTNRPEVVDGHLLLPNAPGWGAEVREEVLAEHHPRASIRWA
jgi:galactonate dehydratase